MRAVAVLVMALAGLPGCEAEGSEGRRCKSDGFLGASYCDEGLICNDAVQPATCQRPMSRSEGLACSADQLCGAGLWCDHLIKRCRPFLKAGEPCTNPFSCGPDMKCSKDLATMTITCRSVTADGGTDAR